MSKKCSHGISLKRYCKKCARDGCVYLESPFEPLRSNHKENLSQALLERAKLDAIRLRQSDPEQWQELKELVEGAHKLIKTHSQNQYPPPAECEIGEPLRWRDLYAELRRAVVQFVDMKIEPSEEFTHEELLTALEVIREDEMNKKKKDVVHTFAWKIDGGNPTNHEGKVINIDSHAIGSLVVQPDLSFGNFFTFTVSGSFMSKHEWATLMRCFQELETLGEPYTSDVPSEEIEDEQ